MPSNYQGETNTTDILPNYVIYGGEFLKSNEKRAFISNLTSAAEGRREAALVQQRRDKSSLDHIGTLETVEATAVTV